MVCVLRRLVAGRRRIRVGSPGRQAVLPSDASIERTAGSRTPGAGSHSLPRDRALRPAGSRAAVSAARAESRFRINLFPGAVAFVLDPYVGGRGILEPTLLGLVSQGRDRSSDALDRAEMMRYLAEAAWYPTALLPSQGVTWFAIDESSANATIHDGHHAVTMLFRFDEFGMIESVSSDKRAATEGSRMVMRPWRGCWSNYRKREGMRIPLSGEASWVCQGRQIPYWRGAIASVQYQFCDGQDAAVTWRTRSGRSRPALREAAQTDSSAQARLAASPGGFQ